ncbi:MAG: hypothetical protein NT075_01625 [Chloroflexi bacterium]|nr:hypothetical protein [Chloroflexota bacterium]
MFVLLICLVGFVVVALFDQQLLYAQQPVAGKSLAKMWIDMGLNQDLIAWFNENARPDDIARVDHISLIDLLDQVHVGKRLVIFKSVADVEDLLPNITSKIDIVGYNLEHGPGNRPDEIADPVGSVIRMRDLTNRYGKVLAFGPDREFALNDGVAIAPYVDIFVLQVQRVQTEPETVRDFVIPLARQLRQANPKLQISVQVRTEGDVVAIADLLDSMKDQLDGLSILTSPETVDVAKALGVELRTAREPGVASSPLTTTTLTTTMTIAKPTATATPVPAILRMPSWFCAGGLLMAGFLGGGIVVTALIYVFQRNRFQRHRTPIGKPHG